MLTSLGFVYAATSASGIAAALCTSILGFVCPLTRVSNENQLADSLACDKVVRSIVANSTFQTLEIVGD
ncbi:hypothetical protein C6341_g24426 [Phytophthora cactorum]|uniref:Uncharacterized protein n=1 Tax=Phytophthora cactorum TaxID=29920 RepID=A0A8T1BHP9_9STRA|nr:hypothetical protein PC117_g21604 [Phytophthora cactorum]KAG3128728.1 hypothetical protein C6341_g24426 [Phytophthora cactorum]